MTLSPKDKGGEGKCLHCGQTREEIKKYKTFCATVTYEGETDCEWPRHRFKPYTAKELAAMEADEEEMLKQMQGFVDFVEEQEKLEKINSLS